jgi:ELWxxDGT repeat protein
MASRILFGSEVDATQHIDLWSYNPYSTAPAVDLGVLIPANASPVSVGHSVLFIGQTSASASTSLYVTDGTVVGTQQLALPTTAASGAVTYIDSIDQFGSLAAVCAGTADGALSLWLTDGTAAGTKFVYSGIDPDSVQVINGVMYFDGDPAATGQTGGTNGLWRSDGTTAGTYRLTPTSVDVIQNGFAQVSGGRIVFRGAAHVDGSAGSTLRVTDGTAAGTHQLFPPGWGTDFNADALVSANGLAFFTFADQAGRTELWASDGNSAGTIELVGNSSGPTLTYAAALWPSATSCCSAAPTRMARTACGARTAARLEPIWFPPSAAPRARGLRHPS